MSNIRMTPYKRVMSALHGERPDRIPFTVYENKIPQCTAERKLRDRGLCVVQRTTSYKLLQPNVFKKEYHYTDEKGRNVVKTMYSTPFGELSKLDEPAGFTTWQHEFLFKSPEDYRAILFMIQDTTVEPAYDKAAKLVKELGEDFVVRDQIPSEPIQQIIHSYIGTENFCYEWMDNQDEILKLYDALVELNRKVYPVVAEGPLEFANYGGNVVPQIIGVDTFRRYFVPNYNEAAEVLHKKDKLVGCHFDADNTIIMKEIGETLLDYIEAYDAGISPSVNETRKVWPDKVLWINWPSAWQLDSLSVIKGKTVKLMEEAEPCKGFIVGITEDLPEGRWKKNFTAIMDGMDEYEEIRKK